MTDENLSVLLHRAVDEVEPETSRLVSAALARGRTLRRRQHVGQATLGFVLAGALGAGVFAIVDGGSPDSGTADRSATTGRPAASEHPSPMPLPVSGYDLVGQLLSELGATGGVGAVDIGDGGQPGWVGAGFTYDDGRVDAMNVSLQSGTSASQFRIACQISTCTTRADGTIVSVYRGDGNTHQAGLADWEVSERRPDGLEVEVTEWNARTEKGTAPNRAVPPFPIAAVQRAVDSQVWSMQIPARAADAAHERLARAEAVAQRFEQRREHARHR